MTKTKDKKGYTLVELMVVFALIGIFMVAASVVAGAYGKISARITALSQAQTLADTLLNRMSQELISMEAGSASAAGTGAVEYINNKGQQIKMYVKDGYLELQYSGTDYPVYGKDTYLGNTITAVNFEIKDDGIVKLTLELTSDKGVLYSDGRVIECYNKSPS